MSCDAFLSEALYEVDSARIVHLKSSLNRRASVHVYKMADGADSESQMYVLFCYFV